MALDFPNSPTLNQTFTAPNGTIWLWDGTKWTAITSTSPYSGQGNVGRNLIHNPLFNVAQRGAGPFTSSGYTLDRWTISIVTAGTSTVTQASLSDSDRAGIGDEVATRCMSHTFTGSATAGAYQMIGQGIEDVRRLGGKTVTVSFWANASAALKLGVNILQQFGNGGSPSASIWALATGASVSIPGVTFARYSVTIPVPGVAGKTLGTNGGDYTQLVFWYSASSSVNALAGNVGVQSGLINIWGVQLEVGSVATPLEKPDPQQDLAKCQRFFLSSTVYFAAYQTAGLGLYATVQFAQMHHTPTVTAALTYSNATAGSVQGISPTVATIYYVATATGLAYVTGGYINMAADL